MITYVNLHHVEDLNFDFSCTMITYINLHNVEDLNFDFSLFILWESNE